MKSVPNEDFRISRGSQGTPNKWVGVMRSSVSVTMSLDRLHSRAWIQYIPWWIFRTIRLSIRTIVKNQDLHHTMEYIPASQTVLLQVLLSGFAQHIVKNIANTNRRHHHLFNSYGLKQILSKHSTTLRGTVSAEYRPPNECCNRWNTTTKFGKDLLIRTHRICGFFRLVFNSSERECS